MKLFKLIPFLFASLLLLGFARYDNLQAIAYRSYLHEPPKDYKGPIYKLNANYPTQALPACNNQDCPWLSIPIQFNFKEKKLSKNWLNYEKEIKKYILKNFYLNQNQLVTTQAWYDLPWQTTKAISAREFAHGAVYSFLFNASDLGNIALKGMLMKQNMKQLYEVWGIAFYNKYAAYTLGQIWNKNGRLNWASKNVLAGLPFKPGAFKIKFNLLTSDELYPHHQGKLPILYINRHKEYKVDGMIQYDPNHRQLQPATVVEIQISLYDDRSPTHNVFLAYAFNPKYPTPKSGNLIENFDLVGIQFGNDPLSFPAVSKEKSQMIHQSYMSGFGKKAFTGCAGRMVAFLGSGNQSCIGCHQTAYVDNKGIMPSRFIILENAMRILPI